MTRWVDDLVERRGIRRVVVFSSPMAQYVNELEDVDRLIDFVDVDSDKWNQYASASRGAMAWLYRREAERLLDFERYTASRAIASVFVTQPESALFRRLAGDLISPVITVENGVDAAYFSPDASRCRPAGPRPRDDPDEPRIVFTGAMDYKPNVDAAAWFSREVLPLIRHQLPRRDVLDRRRASDRRGALARAGRRDPRHRHRAPKCGRTSRMPASSSCRCASRAASRTRRSRRWRWARRRSCRRRRPPRSTRCRAATSSSPTTPSRSRAPSSTCWTTRARGAGSALPGAQAVLENYDWSRNLARIDRCFDSGFDRSVDQLFEIRRATTGPAFGSRRASSAATPPGPLLATEVEHA